MSDERDVENALVWAAGAMARECGGGETERLESLREAFDRVVLAAEARGFERAKAQAASLCDSRADRLRAHALTGAALQATECAEDIRAMQDGQGTGGSPRGEVVRRLSGILGRYSNQTRTGDVLADVYADTERACAMVRPVMSPTDIHRQALINCVRSVVAPEEIEDGQRGGE